MNTVNPVLAQKLGLTVDAPLPEEAVAPPTPMRQMRRALGRAADTAANLSSSVLGIVEEDVESDVLIDTGPEGWVVLGLRDGDHPGLTGLFLVDPPLRSALVEMQTMGSLLPAAQSERKVTRTDGVMVTPFATQLLQELAEVGFGSGGIDPSAYDIGVIDDLHTAGLVMTQGCYRMWRISVQVGGADRQGEIMIAVRQADADLPDVDTVTPEWSAQLRAAVEDAPAELDATLGRLRLPIHKIEKFEVGQVLHLPGTTVGSVNLTGPDGAYVATARLGQVAGKRAVRIEPLEVEMQDVGPVGPSQPDQDVEAAIDASSVVADQLPPQSPPQSSETDLIES